MDEFDKRHRPALFTDVSLDIRDAEVCITCHTVLDAPEDWPEDGPEWRYPWVQVPWPCAARVEVDRLRALGGEVCQTIYRQHPETGMVQRIHPDGTHHMPSFNPQCARADRLD